MAWSHYWVETQDVSQGYIYYQSKSTPGYSVSETWTTVGLAHGRSRIIFEEYRYHDKDPDGVREAYGSTYQSEYSMTVDASHVHPEELFIYTVYMDGRVVRGADINMDEARAVYAFATPQDFTSEMLLLATEHAENAPHFLGEVEEVIAKELLGGREDVAFLVMLSQRV